MSSLSPALFSIVAIATALPAALISAARAFQLIRENRSSNKISLRITRDGGEVIELTADSLHREDLERILQYLNDEVSKQLPGPDARTPGTDA
ncbi:hypothetical protein [Micromonospora sp. WMMD714]|uniref:hypothetical protein n=1 Tax=Micromonospora sp. WMMD714 TaxID=3016097 RepID=UPI00249A8DB5|nr:hypothetical protein [Micromonospora sp. WMMD714]WFE63519.1 hypothetical protein O7625_09585 [Micromonospora sp. WMMD714]